MWIRDSVHRWLAALLKLRLRTLLGGYLDTNPKIERIRVSIFGFSRGAAEARVFANWLKDACDPPEGISFYAPLSLIHI